jgi:hypothetical protein
MDGPVGIGGYVPLPSPSVSSYWPPDDCMFSSDRGDIALGTVFAAVVSGVLYLLAGWVAVAAVGAVVLALAVALGAAAVAYGHRGWRVVPLALRLASPRVRRSLTDILP